MQTLNPKRTKYVTALWEVDPAGERPARRLTRSAKGEGGAAYLPDGSLLFTSARPDPEAGPDSDDDDEVALLWLLPAGGGEARVVATRPGGVDDVHVAAEAGTVALSSGTFPSSETEESEKEKRKARKEKKVSAILHQSVPVRFWDEDLGPDAPRIFTGSVTDEGGDARIDLTDLTPDVGRALERLEYDVSPDGSTIATTWGVPEPGGLRTALAVIDVATRRAPGASRRRRLRARRARGSARTASSSCSSGRSARPRTTPATSGSRSRPSPTGPCAT